jgi:hypothetical protein
MLHLLADGHYITVGLAWLPLVLLCLERTLRPGIPPASKVVPHKPEAPAKAPSLALQACDLLPRRGSLVWATGAGALFALLILGTHPQWTFYAGLFVGLWTLGPTLEEAGYLGRGGPRSWGRIARALGRWLALGVWVAATAVLLSAIQLLPTLEAARESTRSGVGVPAPPLTDTVLCLVGLAGTSLRGVPLVFGSEYRSGLGVLWITAAVLAPVLRGGRVRFQAAVCLLLIFFALGGATLFQALPGFRLFRLPSRMFLLVAFPVALLSGIATDDLLALPALRCRLALAGALGLALLSLALEWVVAREYPFTVGPYWFTLALTAPLAFWLFGTLPRHGDRPPGMRLPVCAWAALLLADLWGLGWPLVQVRPDLDIYEPSACLRYVLDNGGVPGRVLDRPLPDRTGSSTPLGPGLPLILGIEQVNGYNPLDVKRFKEYMQFAGGLDRPLKAEERLPLFAVKNKKLLDLLGVRYLIQPDDLRLLPRGEEDSPGPGWRKVCEDAAPLIFAPAWGGMQRLPPYTLYENVDVFPRAFVVTEAAPLPARPDVLAALEQTDLRRTVLLEPFEEAPATGPDGGTLCPAEVVEYQMNRVAVRVADGPGGWLVLADVWFPGWQCRIDGQPAPLYRADYLFRATRLSAGAHEVVFTFDPASYHWGRAISLSALAALGVLAIVAAVRARRSAPRGGSAA